MPSYVLTHLSDTTLLADLAAHVAADRQSTAVLLAHLAEVDERGLFLPAACTSMHVYCTRVLRLSDEAAFKRIRAARVGRRFPQIFEAIADGRVHLSGIVALAAHVTAENVDDLIRRATHLRKADIEVLVAELAPQPDVKASIRRLPAHRSVMTRGDAAPLELSPGTAADSAPSAPIASEGRLSCTPTKVDSQATLELSPGTAGQRPAAPVQPTPERGTTRTTPLAPGRYALRVTIDQATKDKLERAQALLRHANPSGDLADVIDRALDALLAKIEKQKFGKSSRPRAKRASQASADASHVSNEVRREVHDRDDERCAFVSADGVRCGEPGFLEFDHETPVAMGGASAVKTVRLLCTAHNQYEAERRFGKEFMRAKREAAKAARAATKARHVDVPEACDEGGPRPTPDEGGARATYGDQLLLLPTQDAPSRCSEGTFDRPWGRARTAA